MLCYFIKSLENGNKKCTACGLCSINCPNQTIKITSHMEETEEGKKKKVLDRHLEVQVPESIYDELLNLLNE